MESKSIDLKFLNSQIQEIKESQKEYGGRRYLHISPGPQTSVTTSLEEQASLKEIQALVRELSKSEEKDTELFSQVVIGLKEVVESDFLQELEKVEAIFSEVLSSVSQEKKLEMLKNSNLYIWFCESRTDTIAVMKRAESLGLSEFQAAGVALYTTNAYRILNALLREQEDVVELELGKVYSRLVKAMKSDDEFREMMEKKHGKAGVEKEDFITRSVNEFPIIKEAITSGLENLPKIKGESVFRGDLLNDEEFQLMKEGVYFDKGVMSFSKNEKESELWARRLPTNPLEKHHALISVNSSSKGRDIAKVSLNPEEEEVVFLPGQKFKVVSLEAEGTEEDLLYRIILEEEGR